MEHDPKFWEWVTQKDKKKKVQQPRMQLEIPVVEQQQHVDETTRGSVVIELW